MNTKEVEIVQEDIDTEETLNPVANEEDVKNIYPQANIKVEREQYSIFELKRKLDKKQLILDPEFQRAFVWTVNQESELIETVLMGIPLPIFYLSESREGKLVVVDGRQRLTSFFRYMDSKFKLVGLRILDKLNESTFGDLDEKLQANLEDFQVTVQVIKPPTPDRVKFDIFDRVNRGGTPLNNQEMRNALYQGKATQLLGDLAKLDAFKIATSKSISKTRMKDRYIILRFLAFYLLRKNKLVDANGEQIEYRNDLDEFLGKTMEYINQIDNQEYIEMIKIFNDSMENSYLIFGENAFRRSSEGDRKNPINMILFESFAYLFTFFEKKLCIENKELISVLCVRTVESNNLNKLLTHDRGRGIVLEEMFAIFENLREEILHDITNQN